MKLLVHIGLHKTGSTYFQHVMNNNHKALAQNGLWYAPQHGYPAHHQAAWQLLMGKRSALEAMIDHALGAGCDTVVLSSEDLESAFHDDRAIDTILDTAQMRGVTEIEWHVVLRDPGECFASLYAQLHHHVYADATQLFHDVMRRGFVHIDQPVPGSGTPYWYFSFDHMGDLARFETAIGKPPRVHDFRDALPFPGWRMVAMTDTLAIIGALPGAEARNNRLPPDHVADSYVTRMLESITPAFLEPSRQLAMIEHFTLAQQHSQSSLADYAEIVAEYWGPSHRRALGRYGVERLTDVPLRKRA